jgi:hypothetical protein
MHKPPGPVSIFGAGNFPLAFSVAGLGDFFLPSAGSGLSLSALVVQ